MTFENHLGVDIDVWTSGPTPYKTFTLPGYVDSQLMGGIKKDPSESRSSSSSISSLLLSPANISRCHLDAAKGSNLVDIHIAGRCPLLNLSITSNRPTKFFLNIAKRSSQTSATNGGLKVQAETATLQSVNAKGDMTVADDDDNRWLTRLL